MASQISTRLFIISDTHGEELARQFTGSVDVVIHCGDLTEESKLTLDDTLYQEMLTRSRLNSPEEDETVRQTYGNFGEARALFEAERAAGTGILLQDKGTHDFQLASGASFKVYADPFTPPEDNNWGRPQDHLFPGHKWDVQRDVDIAITYSPPRGVLDRGVGCSMLFTAIAKARPLMHCFGHIHEAWGAKKVTWQGDEASDHPTHLTEIDGLDSEALQSLDKLRRQKVDAQEDGHLREELDHLENRGYCYAAPELQRGKQTLFVNAAIEGAETEKQQMPWLVELDLPQSKKEQG